MSRSENADASAHRAPAARPLDYLFVTRPTVAVGMWVFFLWGAASAALSSGGRFPLLWPPRDAATGLAAMTAVLAGGCLLNQIVDVDSDRVNRKLFFLPRGIISQRAARLEMVLLWILAAMVSARTAAINSRAAFSSSPLTKAARPAANNSSALSLLGEAGAGEGTALFFSLTAAQARARQTRLAKTKAERVFIFSAVREVIKDHLFNHLV